MSNSGVNRVSGYVILGLSLFELLLVGGATVLTALGRFSPAPDGDEGAAARLFQLALVLLVPAGVAFLLTADWHQPVKVARRLGVPAVALIVAFAVLFYMERPR